MPVDGRGRHPLALGVVELDLAGEDDLAVGVEGRQRLVLVDAELGGRVDRALGDLFVGDLGAAGERCDLAEALGERADEGGARGGLGDGEEGAGVLGADVVRQLVALRAGGPSPRPRRRW